MNSIDSAKFKAKKSNKQLLFNIIKVKEYLNKKKVWDHGYIKYSAIKKMIAHITKLKRTYIVRKIFLLLLDDNFFSKKQNGKLRSYHYRMHDPNLPNIESKSITISFT